MEIRTFVSFVATIVRVIHTWKFLSVTLFYLFTLWTLFILFATLTWTFAFSSGSLDIWWLCILWMLFRLALGLPFVFVRFVRLRVFCVLLFVFVLVLVILLPLFDRLRRCCIGILAGWCNVCQGLLNASCILLQLVDFNGFYEFII